MLSTSRKVVLGAALRTGNLAANAVVLLLVMPFVVRMLGDRMYGIWVLVGAFVGYYGLVDLGPSSEVTRHLSAAVGAEDYDRCNRVYNTALRWTFFFGSKISACVAAFIGFGLIAWGKPFITRWMGHRYLDAYPCLVVLVTGWVSGLAQSPSVQLLFGISKHKFFAWFNSLEGGSNLILSILLARKYGILGVALGTMIPMLVTKLIQPIYVCSVASLNYFEYVRRMARTSAIIIVALIIPLLLTMKLAAPIYRNLAAVALLFAISYVLILWFLEFTPAEAKILERAILPKPAPRLGGG